MHMRLATKKQAISKAEMKVNVVLVGVGEQRAASSAEQ